MVGYHYEQRIFVPIAQQVNGELQYIVTDQIGTPKEVYSEDGELLWSAKNSLWGKVQRVEHLKAANDIGSYTDCSICISATKPCHIQTLPYISTKHTYKVESQVFAKTFSFFSQSSVFWRMSAKSSEFATNL